jgi:hypothetical protein
MQLYILIIFLNFLEVFICQGPSDWKLKRDRNQIIIYVREQAGSPLKEYRATATIRSPVAKVFKFIMDLERRPEWVFRCTGLTIIDRPEENHIRFHTTYDVPWPMKDRDLTAETIITMHEGGRRMEMLTQHVQLDYPSAGDVVRMPDYREWVMLEEVDSLQTLFETEGYADFGGSIPPWLVNMFLVDGLYDSVIKMRERVEDNFPGTK